MQTKTASSLHTTSLTREQMALMILWQSQRRTLCSRLLDYGRLPTTMCLWQHLLWILDLTLTLSLSGLTQLVSDICTLLCVCQVAPHTVLQSCGVFCWLVVTCTGVDWVKVVKGGLIDRGPLPSQSLVPSPHTVLCK